MAFSQGVLVTGGYRSCPAVQCGAIVTTALTHEPPFFVALIRTHTRVHKRFASLVSSSTLPVVFSLQRYVRRLSAGGATPWLSQ